MEEEWSKVSWEPSTAELCRFCQVFSVVPGPAASASSRNLIEMQILRPHPDLPIQKLWGWGPAVPILSSPLDDCEYAKVSELLG